MDDDGVDTDGLDHVTRSIKDLDIKNTDDVCIAMYLDDTQVLLCCRAGDPMTRTMTSTVGQYPTKRRGSGGVPT
jgi:hypothetical protein